jgi:tartrate-resistant acid phosphatase type 5
MAEIHREEYVYLGGLTHRSVLVAWGAFFFEIKESKGKAKIVDDSSLKHVHPPRKDSIGRTSSPYGEGVVEVFDLDGNLVARDASSTTNYTWVAGLEANKEYTYTVTVNGKPWAGGPRLNWEPGKDEGRMVPGKSYDNRFRTSPDPKGASPALSFVALGDFGRGVRKLSNKANKFEYGRQLDVANGIGFVVDRDWGTSNEVRFLMSTGDNIYAQKKLLGLPVGGQGDEDDDWFFTFFQPYRYVINRVPIYPVIGNHDTGESEEDDDRDQVIDNLYIEERFLGGEASGTASIEPGLFYRFPYGKDVEFIAIDTSKNTPFFGKRFFEHPNHRAFVDTAFPADGGAGKWRIPFGHHPFYCAGPQHSNTESLIDFMTDRFKRAGVKVYFSGHEHMYQHSDVDGVCYLLTGGAGKIRTVKKAKDLDFEKALTTAWAAEYHFLKVDLDGDEMQIHPLGAVTGTDSPMPIKLAGPTGEVVETPIRVKRV